MNNIIRVPDYKWGKFNMDEKLKQFIEELTEKNRNGYLYSMQEIDTIALQILDILGYSSNNSATPIVKILKQFGFKAFQKEMPNANLSGDISINGEANKTYEHDKIIFVNNMDELDHQRFVAAHELAHYLFDYLGSEIQSNKKEYSAAYLKDHHDAIEEQRANRFAAAILMPRDLFTMQYYKALSEDSSPLFIERYLVRFFETSSSSIKRRIHEVILNKG